MAYIINEIIALAWSGS